VYITAEIMMALPLAASRLAKAASNAGADPTTYGTTPSHAGGAGLVLFPAENDLVTVCQQMGPAVAMVLILIGAVYLLWGLNLFRFLIVVNFAAVGAAVGLLLGGKSGAQFPLAVIGAVLGGAISWPLMKYAVAIHGGALGAMIGATVWRLVELDPNFAWSGALIGLVAGGLLCFILFRGCVMLYTSLQGAMMLMAGILGLLMKTPDLAPKIGAYLISKPFILPMIVFIPAVIGMLYQQAYAGAPKPAGGAPAKK